MYRVSAIVGNTSANTDIVPTLKNNTSLAGTSDLFVIKKITIIADAELNIKVNNENSYFPLYLDPVTNKYIISLDTNDVNITSIITQEAGVSYWAGFVF
jgi:hypothetical protein